MKAHYLAALAVGLMISADAMAAPALKKMTEEQKIDCYLKAKRQCESTAQEEMNDPNLLKENPDLTLGEAYDLVYKRCMAPYEPSARGGGLCEMTQELKEKAELQDAEKTDTLSSDALPLIF
jgi:hypothetical protein